MHYTVKTPVAIAATVVVSTLLYAVSYAVDPNDIAVDDSEVLYSEPLIIVDDNTAAVIQPQALPSPDFASDWVVVQSDMPLTIYFVTGFLPKIVSVLVQMYDCSGSWVDRYSYVPPAHTAWDDMYTNGGNVYWLESDRVVVHHEAVIRGTNIHDGCWFQRFRVYAWQ